MAFTESGTNMYMPVAPMGGYYGANNGYENGFGMNGMWWILALFLLGGNRWGYGSNNGGGYGGGVDNVAIGNIGSNYRDVQDGFNHQATMNALTGISGDINAGFANTATSMCNGFSGVTSAVNNGFANAEMSNNARQIANMQQQFASQTAINSGMNDLQAQLAQCCCDNRLATANLQSTILAENCADRTAVQSGVTQILQNQNNNTQRMVDTTNAGFQSIRDELCQFKIDNITRNYENQLRSLQNALDEARSANQTLISTAAINAQTAQIVADNSSQTSFLQQYLAPRAIPAYVVQNPNGVSSNCWNTWSGCNSGCGNCAA